MVLDALSQLNRYLDLHPRFRVIADAIASRNLAALLPNRYEIDGARLYLSIDENDGRGHARARLESHRRYIDIQVTLAGDEEIGWRPVSECYGPTAAFDEHRDIQFYGDIPQTWLAVPPGFFAIFFPHDAHAPLAGAGRLKKAIFKIEL
ncbi:MAG TPA: YhcH/YjgK/YiaL family protein [Vicinamibacterales bacterium]|nr:YhcH/YjgK/YiaL family protein [Vicinamibacterales bacterium]